MSSVQAALAACAVGVVLAGPVRAETVAARALDEALQGTQAAGLVLDARTGALLAERGTMRHAAPGSAGKPLLLEYALEHGIVQAGTEVYCRRSLHIAGRALECTHPADNPVFTAERALAESCNTWFAELGRRFTGPQLEDVLREAGWDHQPMTHAGVDQRQLAVLGLSGVQVTPLELAKAYVALLGRAPEDGPVMLGLRDSVRFGMANGAAVPGMSVLGKTGTASDAGEAWTHGWFAGALPGRCVLVIFVPHGDGGTAAVLARRFFQLLADGEARR